MLNKFLVIDVSIASIVDKPFNQWLISEVSKLNIKASRLVFLLPLQFSNEQKQIVADFSQRLKRHHCKVALNDFLVSTPALNVLKLLRPDYIRLSLEWINRIEGQDNREISLGRAIRQLESKDISVIIPNGVSSPMCKNFSLAGASFCQEKAIR